MRTVVAQVALVVMVCMSIAVWGFAFIGVRSLENHHRESSPHEMTADEACARAAGLTGRVMDCWGSGGAYQCRPAGISQTEHPELIVRPVVACFDGSCRVTPRPHESNCAPTIVRFNVTGDGT